MEAPPHAQDRADLVELQGTSSADVELKIMGNESSSTQLYPSEDKRLATSVVSQSDQSLAEQSRDAKADVGYSGLGAENNFYPTEMYATQVQPIFYGGYDNSTKEWEDYSSYMNVERMDMGSTVVYNEDPSMMYHTGYGFSPQVSYGPYPPISTDGHLYSPQGLAFAGYFQQPATPDSTYIGSLTATSQAEPMMSVDPTQGSLVTDTFNMNSYLFRPTHDWSMPSGGNASIMNSLNSPVASQSHGPFGQSTYPPYGTATPNQKSLHGLGSSSISFLRDYSQSGILPHIMNQAAHVSSSGISRGSFPPDKSRGRGRGGILSSGGNGSVDFLNELSRGPRTTRPKASGVSTREKPLPVTNHALLNSSEFDIQYKNAKFFVIKSYSEDNIHKSIKYGVWASTANGNKKLDSAFRETKAKEEPCPVFLFFSVNASGQFVGVAEMVGPVDFEKSVDYWQQDKWTGQFPVKWHIVKDVPNNLFRHIILENNDNKPVTNSRDTQEVKFEQGLEMLKIFKNYDEDMSVIDDFDFYERREKAMQESKAQLQHQHQPHQLLSKPDNIEAKKQPLPIPADLMTRITQNFADAVRLQDPVSNSSSNIIQADRKGSLAGDSSSAISNLDDTVGK